MINLPTKENYEKFRKNPKIDPETGKRLTIGKAPYLRYLRLCDEYEKIMNSIVSTPVLGLCPRDPSGAGGAPYFSYILFLIDFVQILKSKY